MLRHCQNAVRVLLDFVKQVFLYFFYLLGHGLKADLNKLLIFEELFNSFFYFVDGLELVDESVVQILHPHAYLLHCLEQILDEALHLGEAHVVRREDVVQILWNVNFELLEVGDARIIHLL